LEEIQQVIYIAVVTSYT